MVDKFILGYTFVKQWEGAYSNDPDDPGGETKYGISKASYPELDIKNLTRQQAQDIYKRDYWDKCGCSNLPIKLGIAVFDTAVNCGIGRSLLWLKKVDVEGERSVELFLQHRMVHYSNLVNRDKTLKKFYRGWMNRITDLKRYLYEIQDCS